MRWTRSQHSLQTVRGRLVAAAAGAIVVAVGLFAAITVVVVGRELRSSLDNELRQRALAVAQLAVSAPAVLTQPGALESPSSSRQLAVEVLDSHSRIVARSLGIGSRILPRDRLVRRALTDGRAGYESVTIGGRPFRLFAAPIAQAGGLAAGGAVLVAAETADISDTLSHLRLILLLTGLGVALLATAAAAALTTRALRGLRRLAESAREIERTADPSRRLAESAAPDELGQLTGVLNRMLSSLERARASERRFLADASHELRTPVTSLLGNVEYAARHGADDEVLEDLRRDAARLARLVEDLLALERADESVTALAPLEVAPFVRETVVELDHGSGRVRCGELTAVTVCADAASLARALGNLIDNGLVHGPPDGHVTVTVRRSDGVALITVADEGPGPDPTEGDRLFERFWRASSASGRPGSGLGLSIVAAIVARQGGTVSVDGAQFTIELPAAPGPVSSTG